MYIDKQYVTMGFKIAAIAIVPNGQTLKTNIMPYEKKEEKKSSDKNKKTESKAGQKVPQSKMGDHKSQPKK